MGNWYYFVISGMEELLLLLISVGCYLLKPPVLSTFPFHFIIVGIHYFVFHPVVACILLSVPKNWQYVTK